MPIRVLLRHLSRYAYTRPVWLSPHLLRLKPAAHCPAPVEAYSLRVAPPGHLLHWQQDPFGNFVARVVFAEPVAELTLAVEMTVTLERGNPFGFLLEEYAREFPFAYEPQLQKDLAPYMEPVEAGPLVAQWLGGVDLSRQDTTGFLVGLNERVHREIAYTVRLEEGVQTGEETLGRALGSCRDSAWLLVGVLRRLGLAARFVSGYWVQLDAEESTPDGPVTKDLLALHAWAEVYLPGAGWLGFDPTSGLVAGADHLPLACTTIPATAAPVTGRSEVDQTDFTFETHVTRLE
ncbi:MAG TPA: transglutaminase family protein [Cytophagales bacterium]|jgi:transglutaminase-like putative cysteine protease